MSTITLKIDTEHLDRIALDDIESILRRAATAAIHERDGFLPIYPYELHLGEEIQGSGGAAARFGFDKNKPKL